MNERQRNVHVGSHIMVQFYLSSFCFSLLNCETTRALMFIVLGSSTYTVCVVCQHEIACGSYGRKTIHRQSRTACLFSANFLIGSQSCLVSIF